MIAQERLQQGVDGLDTARLLSAVQDEVLSALYDFVAEHVLFEEAPRRTFVNGSDGNRRVWAESPRAFLRYRFAVCA